METYQDLEDEARKKVKLFPGSIITKNLESYFSAIVLEVNEKGIYCESNENKYIPRFTFLWEGDYIKLADLRGYDFKEPYKLTHQTIDEKLKKEINIGHNGK